MERNCDKCIHHTSGMCDSWDCKMQTVEGLVKETREKAITDAIEASAKAICIGCGYLDGHSCTYKGSNCGVSKPMLEVVVKALEQMNGE